ncbi:hypothetical protein EU523_00355 [Candidatus Heimdallarchaeota archaeon]|nr:MAG: hypothetical protein EU523_00355 [Candidatus Heimdallarchaeota archaeon]
MVKCEYPDCDREEHLPFRCRYCGKVFCSKHRLPENHDCEKLEQGISPLYLQKSITSQEIFQGEDFPQAPIIDLSTSQSPPPTPLHDEMEPFYATSYDGQIYTVKPTKRKMKDSVFLSLVSDSFTIGPEILDFLVGVLIITLSFGFTAVLMTRLPWSYAGFLVAIVVGAYFSFIFPPKLLAARFGYPSRYVLTKLGVILTLITLLSPVKFLSPGNLIIPDKEFMAKKRLGLIYSSSFLINLLIGISFILLSWLLPSGPLAKLFLNGAFFTSQLSLLNLIPFSNSPGNSLKNWNWFMLIFFILSNGAIFIACIVLGVFTIY